MKHYKLIIYASYGRPLILTDIDFMYLYYKAKDYSEHGFKCVLGAL